MDGLLSRVEETMASRPPEGGEEEEGGAEGKKGEAERMQLLVLQKKRQLRQLEALFEQASKRFISPY
eukprot:1176404-Prorocentrum_minimum.AAC.2